MKSSPKILTAIIVLAAITAIGFLGYEVVSLRDKVATLRVNQSAIESDLVDIESDLKGVRNDAAEASAVDDLSDRIGDIERDFFGVDVYGGHDQRISDLEDCVNSFFNQFVFCPVEIGPLLPR